MARLVSGVGFPHEFQGREAGDHPFLKVSDLSRPDSNGYSISASRNWVTREELRLLGARLAPRGSIVFPKVGAALLKNPRRLLSRSAAMDNNLMAVIPQTGDSRFMLYALSLIDLGEISGSGPLPFVNEGQIRDLRVIFPEAEKQRRIADFLDVETVRIDSLKAAYLKLGTLVREHSQSALDAAIEKQRETIPLRYLVQFREGPGIMAVDFQDEGVPLVRISGLKKREVTLGGCNYLDPAKAARQWSQFRLKMGDLLISGSATMGEVSEVKDPEVVGAIPYTGLMILRPAHPDIKMEYVEAFLRSTHFARQIDLLKTGATMQHFGPTHLSQVKVPFPGREKQRAVALLAQQVASQAERGEALANRQMALLAERRQALITAAVTGQIDVSTASRRGIGE
ncbi:hypothetical protein [Streptomyces sp. NBC_01498]|uniref:hypothetical protein n=1 Tax=Streptomyces sp. NBC_01498 TaxID=2975870 RepID=UPI002E7B7B4E|nr:hypothetical protein [Streptomyces sp. NBC_01498]